MKPCGSSYYSLEPWTTWAETDLIDVYDFCTIEVESPWMSFEVIWPLEALVRFVLVQSIDPTFMLGIWYDGDWMKERFG